jgi:uncharacterized protein with FMN-binding domain
MSKAKKAIIIISCVLIVAIAGIVILIFSIGKTLSTYKSFDYSRLDLASVEDGTYTGSEDGGMVSATVEVTVKNHIITDVTILSHKNGKGKPAEVIVNDIVANNSLEVDSISGATFSSNVIKKAVYNALTD